MHYQWLQIAVSMVLGTTVSSTFPYFQATVADNQLTPLRAKSYQHQYSPKRAVEHFLTKNSKFEISREILCGCQRLWSALHQALIAKQKKKTKSRAFIPRADVLAFAHVTQLKMKQSKSKSSFPSSLELPHHHPSFLPSSSSSSFSSSSSLPSQLSSSSCREVMASVKQDHKRLFVKNQLVVRNLGRDIGAILLYWLYTKHSKY